MLARWTAFMCMCVCVWGGGVCRTTSKVLLRALGLLAAASDLDGVVVVAGDAAAGPGFAHAALLAEATGGSECDARSAAGADADGARLRDADDARAPSALRARAHVACVGDAVFRLAAVAPHAASAPLWAFFSKSALRDLRVRALMPAMSGCSLRCSFARALDCARGRRVMLTSPCQGERARVLSSCVVPRQSGATRSYTWAPPVSDAAGVSRSAGGLLRGVGGMASHARAFARAGLVGNPSGAAPRTRARGSGNRWCGWFTQTGLAGRRSPLRSKISGRRRGLSQRHLSCSCRTRCSTCWCALVVVHVHSLPCRRRQPRVVAAGIHEHAAACDSCSERWVRCACRLSSRFAVLERSCAFRQCLARRPSRYSGGVRLMWATVKRFHEHMVSLPEVCRCLHDAVTHLSRRKSVTRCRVGVAFGCVMTRTCV